jgi:very-short-patch-repair endonuclease
MEGQTNSKILRKKLQRALRNDATDAERHLWQHLRGRQLDNAKFRRQHPFKDYVLDFACLERKLAVELDGGQHASSRQYDTVRSKKLEQAGFKVLRFWNQEVLEHATEVADAIYRELLACRQTRPHPGPPLEGEGEQQAG